MKFLKINYPEGPTKVGIHESRKICMVPVKEIIYCEAHGSYTFVYRIDGSIYVSCKNLRVITRLLDKQGFARIHKSYLVNMECIKTLIMDRKAILVLTNDKKLDVARRKKQALLKKLFN